MSNISILQQIEEGGIKRFVINPAEEFELPKKIYGDLQSKVNRVISTFKSRDKNLGVLLSGLKGNSKTTTAKMICINSGMPVILITQPFTGAEFHSLLAELSDDTIVFIDEFEKVYHTNELQQEFLTILDGAIGGKKLFLFTSNSSEINQFLRNRPSRIFYHFKFDNLEDDVVTEIITAELKKKEWEKELREVLLLLGYFSMDVLLNFIDEINRFNTSPKTLVKGLNIEVEHKDFQILMFLGGKRYETQTTFNPVSSEIVTIEYKTEDNRYRWKSLVLKDYTRSTAGKQYIYEKGDEKYIFTPFRKQKFEL